MKKNTISVEYLIISIVVFIISSGLLFFASLMLNYALDNAIRVLAVSVCLLISCVVYLLLSMRAWTEIAALRITKSLSSSLEQFEKLFDEAPVPYLILSEKGEILKANKSALRFFGVVFDEIKNKSLFSYQPPEDKEQIEKLERYYKSNVPINKEDVRMMSKDGALKWALLSVFEMKNFGEFKNAGLATVFDMTEQKQLDQAKTEFVSLASHQLKTPVSTVKWYTDMLLSGNLGELSEKQKSYVDIIHNVNEEMIDLIDVFLNISRIEIGSLKIDMKEINVAEVTESVLVELSSQIKEKNINIEKRYNDSLKNMKSDPKLLRVIIHNLLTNAVKYTLPGGIVTISFKDAMGEKIITVSDNGVGIPKEEQEKIFTKLFRATNVKILPGSQGTGLGLYLIKSMVEKMGGGISFTSEENKGTAFTVTF
jgi:PAS domain S-box-containing protein